MAYSVFNLKNSVAGILSGLDISNVDNLDGALERAARVLVQKADIPEASGIQNITLYSNVFDYPIDPRIFGTTINDIRPQGVNRNPNNFVFKRPQEQFDRTKNYGAYSGTTSTFEYYNGTPIIRIVSPYPLQRQVIDQMNATTGWVLSGSASNLVADSAVYYQQPASLRFTLTGSSTGTLSNTLASPVSISSYQGVGVAFLAIDIPSNVTASQLTSISLKLGSDSSDYNEVTSTQGFLGAWTVGNWLLVAFDFSIATTVGTPNWNAIAYESVIITTATTMVNFRIGGLWICQPSPAQILYQSAAIFLPVGATQTLTTITTNTDTIILNDAAYSIYEYESALSILQQTGGGASDGTMSQIESILNGARTRTGAIITEGLYDLYRGDNPSQALRLGGSYYDDDGGNRHGQGGGYG